MSDRMLRLLNVVGMVSAVLMAGCGKSPRDEVEKRAEEQAQNRAPVVKSVSIYPDRPTGQQDLRVTVQARDADGDPVEVSYQWLVNGYEVDGETDTTLSHSLFEKGDAVQCMVVASDREDQGEPVLTEPVEVANAFPIVDDVRIEPEILRPGVEARVVVEAHDPDGDPLTHSCEWYVNEELMEQDTETCVLGDLTKEDRVYVKVALSDGQVQTRWAQSRIVGIANRPPEIVSEPPLRWDPEEGFQYVVQTRDPDGDPVSVRLEGEIPAGAQWDESTRTLTWKPPEGSEDVCRVKVVAEDPDGGMFAQEFTLSCRPRE